jgi:hypothetical protein
MQAGCTHSGQNTGLLHSILQRISCCDGMSNMQKVVSFTEGLDQVLRSMMAWKRIGEHWLMMMIDMIDR